MGDELQFEVEVDTRDGCNIVHVRGDLDLASADEVEQALASAQPASHVILDLSECTFVDSTGIRLIASTVRAADRVSVVATDPGTLRILEITALDSLVAVHPTVDSAL